MKPSQIRVFDGLRITTDHVNHLQGAFYSGLEDFREILGLGTAQTGLELAAQDDGSIVIQPGLAFDFEKNRVPVDSPQTVKLAFATPDEVKYICLKHAQVEDGPVEGHPTMIWDSSTIVVRADEPGADENLVTLARVGRTPDGKLCIHSVEPRKRYHKHGAPAAQAASPPGLPAAAAAATAASPPGASATTPATTPAVSPPPPAQPAATVTPPPPAQPGAAAAATAPANTDTAPATTGFQIRQGIVQLKSDPGANLVLKTVLAPALRQKISADSIDLSFTLAQIDINPDIAVAAFTSHLLLSVDLTAPGATPDATPARFRMQSASHGEATVNAGAVAQFGFSTMQAAALAAGQLWCASDVTGRGMGQFAFPQFVDAPAAARLPLPAEALTALDLLVQLDRGPNGFLIALKLLWSGKASEETVHTLETQDFGFTWSFNFGWKAFGN